MAEHGGHDVEREKGARLCRPFLAMIDILAFTLREVGRYEKTCLCFNRITGVAVWIIDCGREEGRKRPVMKVSR